MPNYLLTAIKSEEGFIFICPNCQARGISALGTSDDVGRHLLICPICRRTLGAWLTSESRERGLSLLAEKLERSFARGPSDTRGKVAYRTSVLRFLQLIKAYFLRMATPGLPQGARALSDMGTFSPIDNTLLLAEKTGLFSFSPVSNALLGIKNRLSRAE